MEFDRGRETSDVVESVMPAVRQAMSVDEVSTGGPQQGYAVRFRGRLYHDAADTYERLAPVFEREELTLLFRTQGDSHLILGVQGVIRPRQSNPWVNVGLFLLTLLSMLIAGVLYGYQGPVDVSAGQLVLNLLKALPSGIPFAASLLGILAAHEFGHYLAARFHKSPVSLPYFLPFPGSPFGTLGAFIQLKAPPKNRRILLDIGLAGPLAGLVVAIPVLLVGLALSDIGTLPRTPMEALGQGLEGNSILYLAAKYLVTGKLVPMPIDYGGVSPLLYWLRYFFIGLPVPYGGLDVLLHPMAWAGWAGLLVTALNLIPAGQLDGGHVVYVLFGRRAVRFIPFIIVILVILGIVWPGWYLWAALIFFLGRTYAQPLDEITPLDDRRKALAIFGLIVFLLVFTPVPLRGF